MAVLVSIRRKLPLADTYLRLRAAGKPAKVAIVATMRKLLVILNAMLRDKKHGTPSEIIITVLDRHDGRSQRKCDFPQTPPHCMLR